MNKKKYLVGSKVILKTNVIINLIDLPTLVKLHICWSAECALGLKFFQQYGQSCQEEITLALSSWICFNYEYCQIKYR